MGFDWFDTIFIAGCVVIVVVFSLLAISIFRNIVSSVKVSMWKSSMDVSERVAKHYSKEAADSDPTSYRGHDLLAAYWKANRETFDVKDSAIFTAAATSVQSVDGFTYDGRAIKDGNLTEEDFEDYFSWLDDVASFEDRYRIFFGETCIFLAGLEIIYNKQKHLGFVGTDNPVALKDVRDPRLRKMGLAFYEVTKDHYLKEFSK